VNKSSANPIESTAFKDVLGHFVTGVTVVSAVEEGIPVGFTCQSFTALSLDPAMIAIAPAKSSTSWPKIAKAQFFCVNVLTDSQEAVARSFAVSRGAKFDGVRWHTGLSGAPIIDSCLAFVECKISAIHDAGDHELVTGHVLSLGVTDGRPLVFYRSTFASLND
jgi:3-hydroxy-9,10-secoandrosta-1,3,5(10)-triene-9,17-dione monooxygenase reductase component